MTRLTIATVALVAALGSVAGATADAPSATVIADKYTSGTVQVDIVVAIPKSIDTAARTGNANWGLDVTLTYISSNNTVETLDSGHKSIKNDTVFLNSIDSHTDAIQLTLSFGLLPVPAQNPSYSNTAQLLRP